jgi:hypothetical protein
LRTLPLKETGHIVADDVQPTGGRKTLEAQETGLHFNKTLIIKFLSAMGAMHRVA